MPLVGAVGLAVMVLLTALSVPIGISFMVVGFFGIIILTGVPGAIQTLAAVPYAQSVSFVLGAMPLYVLMGSLAYHGGIARDLYSGLHAWIGRFRGGLAMATVGACGGFAAVSGSSMATAATMGSVTYGEMQRYNYSPRLSTGVIAAGGTIGILIPPSIIFIIYSVLTETSVAKLFIAGVFPGLLEVLFYCFVIYLLVRRNPALAPLAPRGSWRERLTSTPRLLPTLLLASIVMGGIYGGIFTPTEAASVGVVTCFVLLLFMRRLTWQGFRSALGDAMRTTGMLYFIIFGALVFNVFMGLSLLPAKLAELLAASQLTPYICLGLILLLYIPLGMFMDSMGMVLLTLPIFLPIFITFGFDLIWIGVLIVRVMEIGLITPPMGLNVFVVKGVVKDVPLGEIFRGVMPFVLADIGLLALLAAFPQISLLLPNMMGK